jgi:predicted carbohydrate-binding protein with CBM48
MNRAVPRSLVKLQYAAARLPFTVLDEWVVARYWGQHAPVRVSFERWLGSLDVLAGRFLADEELSRRGLALLRLIKDPAQDDGPVIETLVQPTHAGQLPAGPAADEQVPELLPADEQAPDMLPAGNLASDVRDQVAGQQEQDDPQQVQQAADGHVTTGTAPSAADQAPVSDAAGAGTVDITFLLPAEVHAETVALCGEFNDWSAEDTQLERGTDGSWRATVALEPGRSYRYRYLLDGQRWENDRQADSYVPNALGSTDSVVVVG